MELRADTLKNVVSTAWILLKLKFTHDKNQKSTFSLSENNRRITDNISEPRTKFVANQK